jgi:diphosphoinositol-polyphosphate diphosphatase
VIALLSSTSGDIPMVITFPCSLEEFTMASYQCDCEREEVSETGQIKAPLCVHRQLRGEAMSADQLARLCFSLGSSGGLSVDVSDVTVSTSVSSSSSSSSRENGLAEVETRTPLKLERNASEKLNAVVTSRKTSRQGRSSQRWVTDEHSQVVTRLVTGCVPILEGGYVLFVSASRKLEWILPKGGWELDETMEAGAIRECYEEAGALGILGPKLTEISYESRKAKKRRLEMEDYMKIQELTIPTSAAQIEASEDEQQCFLDDAEESKDLPGSLFHAPVADEVFAKICRDAKQKSKKHSDETSSVASDASATCTHVRMSLFPLYVTEIKDIWPESGRLRKALLIDDAIEMLEMRPEMRAALQEVKAKGLDKPIIFAGEQPNRLDQLPPGPANPTIHPRLIL